MIVVLYEQLLDAIREVYLVSFALSAALLSFAYNRTSVAHLKRQIRLIGTACVFAFAWAAFLVLLSWTSPQLDQAVPPATFLLGGTCIPLAYLAGGVAADLMQLEQVVRRVLLHVLTTLSTLLLLAAGAYSGLLIVTPTLTVVFIVLVYSPLYTMIRRLVAPPRSEEQRALALRKASIRLRSSLETPYLLKTFEEGLREAFHAPPFAMYHRSFDADTTLTLTSDQKVGAPIIIDARLLDRWKRSGSVVLKAATVQHYLSQEQANPEVASLVFHPVVVLWGLIRDQQQKLLALVLLGPRGDDDPYEPEDLVELEQFLGTTALALTNSASFTAKVAARDELRALREHAEQIEEQTAADIARDLHDRVISGQLCYNLKQLSSLLREVDDPRLRERLDDIRAGEETISETIRVLCDQLKPTGSHNPLGLVSSLNKERKWIVGGWKIPVLVQAEHEQIPLSRPIHRALVKITHEALVNAVTHGKPSFITVRVVFPARAGDSLVLTVANDGPRPVEPIRPKPKHWGVRNMQEYADAIGASIRWEHPEAGGTCVIVHVPPAVVMRMVDEVRGQLQAQHESDRYKQDLAR